MAAPKQKERTYLICKLRIAPFSISSVIVESTSLVLNNIFEIKENYSDGFYGYSCLGVPTKLS